ncbi:PQQ-dependent sugar dehydrogenase [bacterium]|nr:PQQ-dependent sugar dehydrogenase [bacterium]
MIAAGAARAGAQDGPPSLAKTIKLPPGFSIYIYAKDVPGARGLALGPKGTVFVGSHGPQVYAVRDTTGDGRADKVWNIGEKLTEPLGLDIHEGDLYVSAIDRILRFDDIEDTLDNPPAPVVVTDKLPDEKHHGGRYIKFGPDGMLYVAVGAPCNICLKDDPFHGLTRMKKDGTGAESFARGIRNTVGYDWHPKTKELWFTDNGRDWLGDDLPPDELNRAPKAGMNFGYPWCHGGDLQDPKYKDKPCTEFTPPARKLGPHVAALGMRFYTGTKFPKEYHGAIFIAEHGSWNRTNAIGYRVMVVKLSGNEAVSYEEFATGFLQPGPRVLGRPADLLVLPDGSMLVSDDMSGMVFRIVYNGK